jgi:hypothetical protein
MDYHRTDDQQVVQRQVHGCTCKPAVTIQYTAPLLPALQLIKAIDLARQVTLCYHCCCCCSVPLLLLLLLQLGSADHVFQPHHLHRHSKAQQSR